MGLSAGQRGFQGRGRDKVGAFREFMKPVYIYWSSGIKRELITIAKFSILDVLDLLKLEEKVSEIGDSKAKYINSSFCKRTLEEKADNVCVLNHVHTAYNIKKKGGNLDKYEKFQRRTHSCYFPEESLLSILEFKELGKEFKRFQENAFLIFVTDVDFGCIGNTKNGCSAISTFYMPKTKLFNETFKTAIYHEFGHLLGVVDKHRELVDNRYHNSDRDFKKLERNPRNVNKIAKTGTSDQPWGLHCLNKACSMCQRSEFSNWQKHLTEERIKYGTIYCNKCIEYLKYKFL